MKIIILALISILLIGNTSAQGLVPAEPPYQSCLEEHDDTKRLACLDKTLNYSKPDIPAKVQPKPQPKVLILVRQKADFDNFGGKSLVAKPAQFTVNQSDGQDTSTVKVGLIGAFRPINDLGWQPYMAIAWNRDTTGKQPIDMRDSAVGITGPLWDAYGPKWTISPNIKFRYRKNLFGKQDSDAVVLHGNLDILPFVNSVPEKDKFSYILVPYFGAQAENRRGGTDNGRWNSDYIGANFMANLYSLVPQLTFSATIQRFHDMSIPNGSVGRTENYATGSFSYELTDPDDKSITVRPALTLGREIGNDLLSGNGRVHKTVLGVTLQIN